MLNPGTVLLHDTRNPRRQNLLFTAPREILLAHTPAEAHAALARLDWAQAEGLHAAGYLAYELGYLFEDRLAHLLAPVSATPLLWLGLYEAPRHLSAAEVRDLLAPAGPGFARRIAPELDSAGYCRAFAAIQALIAAGDVYQVNLTFKAYFELEGDAIGLYRALVEKQPVAYGGLIVTEAHTILSRSPELFIANRAGALVARPMKGTRRRGLTLADDGVDRLALAGDPKNRAENLMIVDLLRNDLSRIAQIGSVKVTDLFTVETYRTLHTLTSGITAKLQPGIGPAEMLAQLFPCGSITGAPKLRAMEIIADLETGPRGIYTGAIGHIAPSGDLAFNVAIRTAIIDRTGRGSIGIGGGIVADSVASEEYNEALLKMAFLTDPAGAVTLIETLLWERGAGYALLQRHLERLRDSARYFELDCDGAAIEALLDDSATRFSGQRMRVRLMLDAGGPALGATELPPNPAMFRFVIAPEPLASDSLWLRHKTTNRAFYDEPRQRAVAAHGVDEVVFCNERGELTEGSITNLFVECDGVLLTPPLSAGLLAGTLRAELLATGRAIEATLTLADLGAAKAIWLGNSVRGLLPAQWIRTETDRL